jgi:AcrR family transcriptional regulator
MAKNRTPSADVEQSIVDAAEALLVEEGPDALTVRRIASAAGVAPMGVYNHLGGKNGVLDALLIRGFDGLTAAISDVSGDDPFEDLAESGRRYRAFAREHPSHYALMFEHSVPDYEPSAVAMARAWASFKELEVLVRRAIAAGVIADGDPTEIAQRIWSTCHGVVSLELRGIGFCDDLPAHQEATSYTMLRGLRTAD